MGAKKQSKIRGKRKREKDEKASKGTVKKFFFLNGNLNQKDKMSAKDMYNKLLIFVESGEIEAEDVPKVRTSHRKYGK